MSPEVECVETESNIIPIQDYQPESEPAGSKETLRSMAVEKIAEELKKFYGGQKEKCVSSHVAAQVTHFCEESPEFAEVVYKTKRTLSDCCAEVMKGVGNHISDLDVYRGIVRAYYPNADVRLLMNIEINGAAPSEEEMSKLPEKPAPKAKPAPKPQAKPQVTVVPPKNKEAAQPEVNLTAGQRFIQLSLF